MGNRNIIYLLLLFLLASCQLIDRQVPSKDELLEKELKSINWEEVDEWPSVSACDSAADKEARKVCFFEFLTQNIQQRLESDTLAVLYPEFDTIAVKVIVNANSVVEFQPRLTDSISYSAKSIDSIIQARLADFPKVNPALKRGLPVKTQFELPVILNVEKRRRR
ncbi:hypothetical protein [Flavobacterium silvaticum]|uniref:Uncharacterized protein n=1 Tax=Flavobacterium silvaticum TaxID=1852020 RepID=A0A972FNG7_9FLAO|nr:hypothetical protein [Flavobacterium silvaticum]NMH28480.1 hypothetical protein [Flavobacterium silvaticum]